ncbi:MAG: DUF6265 family protein [Hyphomonadaceae bacterium]
MRKLFLMLAVVAGLGFSTASAQEAQQAQIEDISWLVGRWTGEGLGGQMEEVWSPASDGQMVGHFSLTINGRLYVYEIMLMDEFGGGLRQRVKHFDREFVGWEDKDAWHAFDFRAIGPGTLLLDGLEYRLDGDALNVSLSLVQEGGSVATETFQLRRTGF